MKCPGCNVKILVTRVQEKEGFKELYIHPETIKPCEYRHDGIRIEVVDEFLQSKFVELVNDASPLNRLKKWLGVK